MPTSSTRGLERTAASRGDRIALLVGDKGSMYPELERAGAGMARALSGRGVTAAIRVAVMSSNRHSS